MAHQENPDNKVQSSQEIARNTAREFEEIVKPELDKFLPKIIGFCNEVLRRIDESGKTAVFIGRDARGLLYLSMFLAESGQKAKLKFIDLSHFYIESHAPDQRSREYEGYLKSLGIDPARSFFIDSGFRGTIIEDIRNQTRTKSLDDMLLVKEPNYGGSIYGFTEGSANGYDENSAMGHFLEGLFGGNIFPIEELVENERGRLPKYQRYKDEQRKEIEHLVVQYFRKTAEQYKTLMK